MVKYIMRNVAVLVSFCQLLITNNEQIWKALSETNLDVLPSRKSFNNLGISVNDAARVRPR
jgi:hypothetical protein